MTPRGTDAWGDGVSSGFHTLSLSPLAPLELATAGEIRSGREGRHSAQRTVSRCVPVFNVEPDHCSSCLDATPSHTNPVCRVGADIDERPLSEEHGARRKHTTTQGVAKPPNRCTSVRPEQKRRNDRARRYFERQEGECSILLFPRGDVELEVINEHERANGRIAPS